MYWTHLQWNVEDRGAGPAGALDTRFYNIIETNFNLLKYFFINVAYESNCHSFCEPMKLG